jgi:GT2 family glycosyltransferase
MKLSVIFVNYNSAHNLKRAILFFIEEKQENSQTEILVVDNGEFLRNKRQSLPSILGEKLCKNIKIIKSSKNIGFGRACNLAAKKAIQENLLFLNPDCFLSFGQAKILFKRLSQKKYPTIVAPLLSTSSGTKQKHASGQVGFLERIFLKKQFNSSINSSSRPGHSEREVDWLSGACFLIRKEVFLQLKGFDPGFFLYFEDKDFSFRAKEENVQLLIEKDVSVKHLESKSRIPFTKRKRYYYQSQDLFLRKHFHALFCLIFCFLRLPVYFKNVYWKKK